MPRDEKGRFTKDEEKLNIDLPHPFTIIKYLIIFILLFPWYKLIGFFVEKVKILNIFYNAVCSCNCKQDTTPKMD